MNSYFKNFTCFCLPSMLVYTYPGLNSEGWGWKAASYRLLCDRLFQERHSTHIYFPRKGNSQPTKVMSEPTSTFVSQWVLTGFTNNSVSEGWLTGMWRAPKHLHQWKVHPRCVRTHYTSLKLSAGLASSSTLDISSLCSLAGESPFICSCLSFCTMI